MGEQYARTLLRRWLAEAQILGDTSANLRRRRHPRFRCLHDYQIRPGEADSFTERSVKGHNISANGLGVISREPIPCAYEVQIQADDQGADEPWLRASVIHCTQTVGGYKVGLELRLEGN